MRYELELQTALDAARQASRLILDAYAAFTAIPDAKANITTEADRQSQELILRHIQRVFPDDALCAEEQTPALAAAVKQATRQWIVDPIDGTRGFAQKNDEYSVMVALCDTGNIVVGVVLEPALRRLTYAVRGQGCYRLDGEATTPEPCRVSSTAALHQATLAQSRSRNPENPSRPVRLLKPAAIRETHSAGIKLALVARGEADLYVNTYTAFHDWDIAAGHVLVEEAGGTLTGLKAEQIRYGSEGAWQRCGLLATNSVLHDAAVKELQGLAP